MVVASSRPMIELDKDELRKYLDVVIEEVKKAVTL